MQANHKFCFILPLSPLSPPLSLGECPLTNRHKESSLFFGKMVGGSAAIQLTLFQTGPASTDPGRTQEHATSLLCCCCHLARVLSLLCHTVTPRQKTLSAVRNQPACFRVLMKKSPCCAFFTRF